MGDLPTHVAADGEPIPSLNERPWDGPDMRNAVPIEQMLEWLRVFEDDDVGYIALWRNLVASIGGSILVEINRDGTKGLMHGGPCDAQIRHRSRWMHFLLEDLDRVETRRDVLMSQVLRAGYTCDQRPRKPRETTLAMREFLKAGGRIMIDPSGHLEDSFAFRDLAHVMAVQRDRACDAYIEARTRFASDRQIKRAVRMLGTDTSNGWRILEIAK